MNALTANNSVGIPHDALYCPSDISQESLSAFPCDYIPPIGELIKTTRERKCLSQKLLSQKTGLTNVQLSRIEGGKSSPSIRTLCRLAPYLGYSIEELCISASYSGSIDTAEPTYTDFDGKVFNLYEKAQMMYRLDGELLLLVSDFYKHYSHSDSELLKTILMAIKKYQENNIQSTNTSTNTKASLSSEEKDFCELFNSLKKLIFSLSKILCFGK